jgi:hypothetical protein
VAEQPAMTDTVHPMGDVVAHDTAPRENGSTGWVIVHHSMDEREHAA